MILSRNVIDLVGWTLVHFLWQGAAVAALYALAIRALPRRSANARYLASCAALLLLTCCPVVTFAVLSRGGDAPSPAVSTLPSIRHSLPRDLGLATPQSVVPRRFSRAVEPEPLTPVSAWQTGWDRLEIALPWLVVGWLVGVLILSIRLLLGWIEVGRIRKQARRLPDYPLKRTMEDLANRLGIKRPVEIAESDRVDVPAMIGWLKPLALIPVGALLWMGSEELESLIAHELAHVRRCDYLVNLAQSLVETLLFYHPAVWWISGRIRSEREACCDDMAVAAVGNPLVYARALAALAEITSPLPALAMAASGGSALRRIRRVLGKPEHGREPLSGWIAGALSATILLAAALPIHQLSTRRRPAATRTVAQKAPAAAPQQNRRGVIQPRSTPGAPVIQALAPSSSLRKDPSMPLSSLRTRAMTWPALAPLVLSLASSAGSPALASPHPTPASPAHRTTAPAKSAAPAKSTVPTQNAGRVREIIPLKYIDCRQAVSLLKDSVGSTPWLAVFQADPQSLVTGPAQVAQPGSTTTLGQKNGAAPPPPLPPTWSRIFPKGTQLIPNPPNNALIAVSSPDGLALLKQMLKPIDIKPRFILFQLVEIAAPAQELKAAGIPMLTPEDSAHSGSNYTMLAGDLSASLQKLLKSDPDGVIARPRLILPGGVIGYVEDETSRPIASSAGSKGTHSITNIQFRILVCGALNSDGSVTVYARFDGTGGNSRRNAAVALKELPPIRLMGMHIKNGDTVALLRSFPGPGKASMAQTSFPSPDHTPAAASTDPQADKSQGPRCLVDFITPNLVDDHGQIVPGGADAIRKAWQEDHQP